MYLLFILLFVIIAMLIVTIRFKIHPFFTLIIAALLVGFLTGISSDNLIKYITEGFGNTLSSIGLIIAFGTIIGVFLEKNGGTMALAGKILNSIPLKRSPLVMNIIGFLVSIPVFCDSGFVILSPINKVLSKKTKIPLVVFAVALATGLYATHVFVPPTPGPIAAAAIIKADIGLLLIIGLLVAIPVSIAGYFWSTYLKGTHAEDFKKDNYNEDNISISAFESEMNLSSVVIPILLPIVLIAMKSVASLPGKPFGEDLAFKVFNFIGNPSIALLLGALLVLVLTKATNEVKSDWVVESLKSAGLIILITGAGGAFGNVLRKTNLDQVINPDSGLFLNGLLIAFLLSALLKTAQGSSTVSIITVAAIMEPLLRTFGLESELDKVLTVLAIGSGALTVSHINDSYFWVVSQFSGFSLKTALKSFTVATFIQGVTGILIVLIIHWLN